MADPLSITASLIAVLQLSTVVVKYLRDVSESGGLKNTLLLEISATKGILETLEDHAANAQETDPVLENVELLQEPLKNHTALLKKLESILLASSKLKKLGKALKWPFEKSDILETLAALERSKTLFGLALHADSIELSKAITQQLSELKGYQRNEEFRDIIRWLSPLSFDARHRDIFSKHQKGTGQWLLNDARFMDWQVGRSRLLWCYGVPGAGKTVFASLAVEHLTETFRNDDEIAVLGIYCDYREFNQQSTSKYLASLLGQLLAQRNTIPEQVKNAFQIYSRKQVHPTFPDYLEMVSGQMLAFKKVYIIIDALDECTESNGVREELLEGILQLPKFVSVMVTSRYIPGIEMYSRNASKLTVRAHEDDIHLHVRSRLSKEKTWARRIRLDSSLQSKIANSIVDRASGMFLLAQLHITSILRKHSRKDVEHALQELPEGLASTYNHILQRIDDQGEEDAALAREVLSWLTYARQPLTAEMLQQALAIRPQDTDFDEDALIHEETLLDVCAGLVVIDPQSAVIHFVHYTTQEYFQQSRKAVFPDGPLNMVTTCLTFLLFEEATKSTMPLLYTFIADNWGHHARESPETPQLVEKIVAFVQDEQRLRKCVQHMSGPHSFSKSSSLMSRLHLVAIFDLDLTMSNLLTQSASGVNNQDNEGRTPLHHAAGAEDGCVVKLLLGRDDVDIDLSSYVYGSPLHSAITSGRQDIVEALIARGVDVESRDAQGNRPIHKAIMLGLPDILQVLLKAKVDVTSMTNFGSTPFELAIQKAFGGIRREVSVPWADYPRYLRVLLDSYTGPDIDKGEMMIEAAKNGSHDIVRLFLGKGASPNIKSVSYNQRIPLHWASEKGYDHIIELLLSHGSEAMARDARGYTPLHYASSAGYDSAVTLLIAKMHDLNIKANNGLTPYQIAQFQGHGAIARLLSQAGAEELTVPLASQLSTSDIERRQKENVVDYRRKTAARVPMLNGKAVSVDEYQQYSERLIIAARFGDIEGVLLCLTKDVDVGERDPQHNKTSLHWAAENGRTEAVQLLLEWGSNISHQDVYGETALHYAAGNGHEDVIDALLKRDPDLSIMDDRGRTVLRYARDNFHVEAVRRFLKQWDGTAKEAAEQDNHGRSLVHWAVEGGMTDLLEKLQALHLDPSAFAPDQRGRTPLQYGCMQSDLTLSETLTKLLLGNQGDEL